MKLKFDPAKNERNQRERDLPFERVHEFDFEAAIIHTDERFDYPEPRFIAIGYLENRLHVLVFAEEGNSLRVISFRKANEREAEKFGLPQKRYQ